jgi:peroxiredoxin
MAIAAGLAAPDFELRDQHGTPVWLSELRGSHDVVIVFFPFAFSGVCSGELAEIRDRLDQIVDERTALLAVSCDHRYALRAYAERDGYEFPLLSDFWPHGEVSRAYGAFDEGLGCSTRVTVFVDRDGVVADTVESRIEEARDLSRYFPILERLRSGYVP